MGIVLKRAVYFITCNGKYHMDSKYFKKEFIEANLILEDKSNQSHNNYIQLQLFNE